MSRVGDAGMLLAAGAGAGPATAGPAAGWCSARDTAATASAMVAYRWDGSRAMHRCSTSSTAAGSVVRTDDAGGGVAVRTAAMLSAGVRRRNAGAPVSTS